MNEIIFKEESYKIIGACYEVYNQQGFGFTEPVYQECLEIELELQKVPFVSQPEIHLYYKERILDQFLSRILFATTRLSLKLNPFQVCVMHIFHKL